MMSELKNIPGLVINSEHDVDGLKHRPFTKMVDALRGIERDFRVQLRTEKFDW